MKKVLIIRNAFSHDFGGAEIHALNLAIELKKNNYEPILTTRVPALLERCKENDIKHQRGLWYSRQGWGRFYKIFGRFIVIWYILIIRLKKIDLVHAHSRDDFVFATKAAKILGVKVVWTDHADLKYIMKKNNSPDLRSSIVELASYATRVIIVSNSEKLEVIKQYPEFPNIQVIHNGVIVPEKISKIKKPKKIIIGCTNRLVKAKGIAELIEGYSKINNIESTELWLLGDGEDRAVFEDLTQKLDITKNVKYLGYKRSVWGYLSVFDIFVQPTYHEAFSNSLVEASVSECAVIATNVGGNSEIINNKNGILVPPKDPKAITSAINKFIENPLLMKEYSVKLKKLTLNEYDFDRIVKEKVIPIYEK